jgi:glycosyltransferase involved in cell wall biosynthesis
VRGHIRKFNLWLKGLFSVPVVSWHPIDPRVQLLFVPTLSDRYIPDADAIFATAWQTVAPVIACAESKGEKCYFIQHYETWMGAKEKVDETWRSSLHKVVVSKWLRELGHSLGVTDLTHIPNAIDGDKYRVIQPIEGRARRVAMMCSPVPFKRALDGIAALETAKKVFPDLTVRLFGNCRRPNWVPDWMSYEQDPAQSHIVEDIYNNSSIVLSSSMSEGFALPPAEGAACGCAIVATDSGGIRDFAEHGITALLSNPDDPQALADNLCLLLGNEDLRIKLARSANERIKNFNWEDSSDLFEQFLICATKGKHSESQTELNDKRRSRSMAQLLSEG